MIGGSPGRGDGNKGRQKGRDAKQLCDFGRHFELSIDITFSRVENTVVEIRIVGKRFSFKDQMVTDG